MSHRQKPGQEVWSLQVSCLVADKVTIHLFKENSRQKTPYGTQKGNGGLSFHNNDHG